MVESSGHSSSADVSQSDGSQPDSRQCKSGGSNNKQTPGPGSSRQAKRHKKSFLETQKIIGNFREALAALTQRANSFIHDKKSLKDKEVQKVHQTLYYAHIASETWCKKMDDALKDIQPLHESTSTPTRTPNDPVNRENRTEQVEEGLDEDAQDAQGETEMVDLRPSIFRPPV